MSKADDQRLETLKLNQEKLTKIWEQRQLRRQEFQKGNISRKDFIAESTDAGNDTKLLNIMARMASLSDPPDLSGLVIMPADTLKKRVRPGKKRSDLDSGSSPE